MKTSLGDMEAAPSEVEADEELTVPRDYQLELLDVAKKENVIVYLPTGWGKTFISVMLIREFSKSIRESKKRVAFLTETVALGDQQAEVISSMTSFQVRRVFGDLNLREDSTEEWKKIKEDFHVFVLTPTNLHILLTHSVFFMVDLCLLVFDECHHTLKSHPYSSIMKDFYKRNQNVAALPKVFGMTAVVPGLEYKQLKNSNNIDEQLRVAIAQLEESMNCKMLTASLKHLKVVNEPKAIVFTFPPAKALLELNWDMFEDYKYKLEPLYREIGLWGICLFLKIKLKTLETSAEPSSSLIDNIQKFILQIEEKENRKIDDILATKQRKYFSDKVLSLCLRVKEIIDEKKEDYRLIVFTKKRASALILNHVIEHINKVKSSYLLGHSSRIDAFMSEVMSLEKQRKILTEFKNGEVKILVSTSVAEEGIDIRPCNFVLMFNGLESIQSYIQTSGRARQKDSKYIVFQEKSDAEIMRIGKEVISSLPQVFKERTLDYEIPITENVSEFYEVESTKARVTLNNSSNLLNRIFGKLTKSPKEIIWEDKDGKKRAILTLPTGFPLQKKVVEGQWYVLRANATKSAALELIKRLHQENILNDHLHLKNDAPKKRIKTANYRLNREEVLVTRKIPAPLVGKWDSPSQDFFGHRICIDETVSKFGLFSLTEFEVPPFQIYLKGQKQNKITFESLHKLTLENPLLEIARKFHTSLFKMLCKGLKGDGLDPNTETYAYLILPINNDDIDWEYLQQFLEPRKIIANTLPRSQLEGKILTTLYDKLSYKVVSVHTGLQLQSPFQGGRDNSGKPFPARPANNPTIDIPNTDNFNPAPKTKSTPSNFLEHFSKKRGFEIIDTNQELVEARRLRYPKNGLRVQQKTEKKTPGIYLPPELCFVEELTTEMHDQAILLPSILIRLESLLIAHQLREACPIRADPDKILEALTPSGVAEGFNYERLENLGDTVLKYLVCLSLFVVYPDYTEGELSERKARLVSNLNLFDLASAKNLGSYSSPEKCTFQEWATSGCKANNQMKIRKKSLSDETEALIAVAYLSDEGVTKDKPILGRRLHNSAKFLEWLDLFKDMQNSLREIEDKLNNYHLEYIPNGLNLYEKEYFVSNVLKYKFRDANLLSAAFSKDSRSCLPFQRLEFIGDAALDLIVLEIMHQKFPKADPGQYTHLKHCVCSNWMFGRISWEYGFQKLGCIDNQTMEKIRVYGEAIAEYKVRMEAEIASRRTEAGFSEEEIRRKHIFQYADADPPKILGDIFESVAGAILVDSGFNLEKVKEVFDPLLRPIMSLLSPECAVFHPTILLLEKCQKEDKNFHWDSRKKDDQWTVQFFIGNELIASATCANKSSAKVKASSEALKKLRVHM